MKKIVALLATSTIILASCSGSGSQSKGKTLNIELPLKTTSIAPYETDVPVKIGAAESLFKSTSDAKVKKLLVKSYEQTSPTQLDLTIKDDIKFQNGHKLTGDSVKSSLENSLKKSDLVKGSLPIKNITADGQDVTITTKKAYPELVSELASPFTAIYDTESNNDIDKKPVGTGPYQVKDYKQSQKINLDKYKDYWQGKPKLDHINVGYQEDGSTRVDNLKAGKVDIITDVPVEKMDTLKKAEDTKVSNVSGFRTSMLLYNHTSDKISKPVRLALNKVIDRESITKEGYKGYAKPAAGPFNHKIDFIQDDQIQKQDLKAAKQIMKKQGYTKEKPLKLNIATYNGRPELPKIAQVIQSDAKKANINIDIRNVDDIEGYLKDKDQWDATMYSFGTFPRGDAGYFFNQAYKKDGPNNKGDYNNDKVNQLIDELNKVVDKNKRHKITNKILKISDNDITNSYIAYNDINLGLNKDVEHVKASPEDIYLIDYKVDKKE